MEESLKRRIWDKARKIKGLTSDEFRLDPCGAIIAWGQFGQNTQFGWVVDHVYPLSLGGGDDFENLRAMQWQNNISKGDDYPIYHRAVTSNGTENIESDKEYRINNETQSKIATLYNIHD